jgi:hypothetical protein
VGEAKHRPPQQKPAVPYPDLKPEDLLTDDALSRRKHHTLEMIIANQRNPNAGDGRQDKPGMAHDVAMATMLAPLCGDRTAQMLVPLPPINENPESEKAVSASIETCLILMAMNDQESMSISADLGLMTRLAPVVWGSSTLKKKLWVLPGMWHISQNYLAGMGKKVENSGVDAALTDAEVYTSATATANSFTAGKDRAASRGWNKWAEVQMQKAWSDYINDLREDVAKHVSGVSNDDAAAVKLVEDQLARAVAFVKLTPAAPLSDDMDEAGRDKAVQEFDVWASERREASEMFRFHFDSIHAYCVYTRNKAATRFITYLGHEEFVKSLYAMMPGLCAFDRPVCARFVAAFVRQIEALKHQPHFAGIWDSVRKDGSGLTVQERAILGTSWAHDYTLEETVHRLAKMNELLRQGMSNPASISTFFAGLPERYMFLNRFEQWAAGNSDGGAFGTDADGEPCAAESAVKQVPRSRVDLVSIKLLENMPSPLAHDHDGDNLHHPLSKVRPESDSMPNAPQLMLGWLKVGEDKATKMFDLRLPCQPSQYEYKGDVPSKITAAMRKNKGEDYHNTPTISLWSAVRRSNIPTFATVGKSYAAGRKKAQSRTIKEWQKVWRRVLGKILNGETAEMKILMATTPVLGVCVPLMDPNTSAVRSGSKPEMLASILSPSPSADLPTTEERRGFGAIVVDVSAALVKVCATLKTKIAEEKKDDKNAVCTWGRVVDEALRFVMRRARRVLALAIYLCVDPYASKEQERRSVKRWAHLDRGGGGKRLTARTYESLEISTVVIGGAGKVMEALTGEQEIVKGVVVHPPEGALHGG